MRPLLIKFGHHFKSERMFSDLLKKASFLTLLESQSGGQLLAKACGEYPKLGPSRWCWGKFKQ